MEMIERLEKKSRSNVRSSNSGILETFYNNPANILIR
ncbi:unnamed protein product, partial [Rotaria magnacalcarata]